MKWHIFQVDSCGHLPTPDFNQSSTPHRELPFLGKAVLVHERYVTEEGREDAPCRPNPS